MRRNLAKFPELDKCRLKNQNIQRKWNKLTPKCRVFQSWSKSIASSFGCQDVEFLSKLQVPHSSDSSVRLEGNFVASHPDRIIIIIIQLRRQDFGSGGGDILGGRPRRGSRGRAPSDARKFGKFPKNFLRKLQKMDYFRRFFKKIKKPCVKISRLGRKTQLFVKFLRKFSKLL